MLAIPRGGRRGGVGARFVTLLGSLHSASIFFGFWLIPILFTSRTMYFCTGVYFWFSSVKNQVLSENPPPTKWSNCATLLPLSRNLSKWGFILLKKNVNMNFLFLGVYWDSS